MKTITAALTVSLLLLPASAAAFHHADEHQHPAVLDGWRDTLAHEFAEQGRLWQQMEDAMPHLQPEHEQEREQSLEDLLDALTD